MSLIDLGDTRVKDNLIDLGYELGTLPAEETSQSVPADKRVLVLNGVPADAEYTVEVRAYRSVDRDIHPTGLIESAPGELPANPFRPSTKVILGKDAEVNGKRIVDVVSAVDVAKKDIADLVLTYGSTDSAATNAAAANAAKLVAEALRDQAKVSADAADAAKITAQGQAAIAAGKAAEADGSRAIAEAKAAAAKLSADDAGAAQALATAKATQADAAKLAAETAKTGAETARTAAEAAKGGAETARTNAQTAATNAAQANTDATNARDAAQSARTDAITKASEAATSATNAGNSATAAQGSASTASTKADAAGASASTANAQANIATTRAGEASISASNAATSATNASGSANSATTQAGVAATSATGARLAAAALLPSDFERKGQFWQTASSGAPGTLGPIVDTMFVNVSGVGTVWQTSNFSVLAAVGLIKPVAGRTYELEARVKVLSDNTAGGNSNTTMQFVGLRADYTEETYISNVVSGFPNSQNNRVTDTDFVVWKCRYSSASPSAYLRPRFYSNWNGGTGPSGNQTVQVAYLKVTDVTEMLAAATSASAASTSASTAATKASEAGTSASAANTSATNAATKAGEASTSASNAATSATNSQGSANTATTQAGVASTARAGAESAKADAETAKGQAQSSASAAAGSASTASTKAVEAGTSASAANTSATNAATSAGNASTFANNASTSAANAQGSANTASTQAGVSASHANTAREQAAISAPGNFPRDADKWQTGNGPTATNLLSTNVRYSVGTNSFLLNRSVSTTRYIEYNSVAVFPVTDHRRYRATIVARWATLPTKGSLTISAAVRGLTSDYTYVTNRGATTANLTEEFATYILEIDADFSGAPTVTQARFQMAFNQSAETAPDGILEMRSIEFVDVTQSRAAETSATAAANSASTASTEATKAGTSATAANTSATNAATKAGEASTSATNAATSATNAQGSANTATTQAGVASSAKTAAESAKTEAETAKGQAQSSASAAAGSASTAATKAGEAGTSASAANTSATNAATKAGEASTSATNAASSATSASGSANTATTQAGVAATQAAAARDIVTSGPILPFSPASGLDQFSNGRIGSPASMGTVAATVVVDELLGTSAHITNWANAGANMVTRGVIELVPGRIYELRTRARVISGDGSVAFNHIVIPMNADYTTTAQGIQFVNTATAVDDSVIEIVSTFGTSGARFTLATGTVYVRCGFRLNTTESGLIVRVGEVRVTDVTDRVAALNSANAAATSASTASTEAGKAGTSATAANTSATNAATSAGNASTSASNASTSATNALGSANTATTQAGVAASNKVAAEKARGDAASYASRNLVRKGVFNDGDAGRWADFGAYVTPISGLPQALSGHTQALYIRTNVDFYENTNDIESSWGNRKIQITGKVMVGGDAGFGVGVLQHGIGLNWLQPATTMHEWRSFSHVITLNENTKTITPFIRVNSNSWAAVTELRWEDVTESIKSLDSANAAAGSASTASTKASEAGTSATAANTAKTAAETAKGQAETYRNDASTSATNAAGSANTATTQAGVASSAKTAAETAKTAAETARGQAQSSATAAAGSASTASTKAGEAGTSATAANNAKTGAETAKGQAETFRNEASTSASNAAGSANTATLQAGVSSRAGNAAAAGNRSPGTAPRLWGVNQYNDFTVTNLLPDTDGGAFSYVNGVLRITNNGVHIHPVANIQIVPGRRYRVVASFKLITDGTQNQNWRTFVTAFDKNGALLGGNTIPFGYLESTTVAAGLQTLGSPEFSTSGVGGSGALPAGTVYIRPMFRASDGVTVDVHSLFVEDVESQSAASQSASAAATSASTASTKASEAGTSATAANTAKTGAETARGQAQTYRDEASTSASNASGSANTATTQAGVASTARNDAQTAAGTATTKAGEAAGSANSAANSASTATTKASEAGTSASAANTAKTAAETAKGQAESFRNDAATSASNAAGSANTATTQAGVAAQSRDKAVAAASRNLVTKNNFADGQLGQWGGAVSVVTDGSDKALRLTDRDCYEGTAFAPISGSRRLRVTARGRAPGAYPLTVGVNTILQNGSLDWSGSMIAAARTSSYATVTNDFVINANAVGYRPWVQSAGNGGAADQDVRVTSIMIEDVTDSHAAQQSASAAAGSASTASTKASEAGSSASAANTAKTGAETARGQAESFRNDASTSASNAQGSANVATTQAGVAASNKVAAEKARGDAASYASRNLVRKGVFNDGDAGSWQQSGATVININTLPQQLSGHSVALYIRTIVDYYEVGNDIESSWGNRKIQISGKVMVGGDAGFGVGVLQHGIGLNWLQPATTMHEWRSFSHVITLNENTKTITPFVRVNSNSWAALTELRWEDVTESQKSLDSANASAGSASTASTKASEAGASAAAANTSKTAAETAKGQAETYRNEASTSASNAAGSANTATTQAGVAASARDVAVVEAAKAFPGLETRFDYWGFDTQSGGRNAVGGWETQRGSGALTFPSPGNWIYMDPKGWIKSVKGKRYKAGIWIWQWGAGGGYGGNVRVYWEGFSANKTSSDYFGAHADAPEATRPFYSAIPNGDWHCYASEFEMTDAVVNHSNGYWFRPRINIDGIPANGAYVVAGWFFEDITDSTSAKGFANAASTSASTASAKADAAGSSASAANTAKTNAETARGQAESYRNEAVSARDTAGGHASTASSQAGLAATYRNEAQGARDTANNHASTAQSQAAIATGAAATATTQAQITARASGGGGNLLLNTEFDYGNMADWTIFGTYASTANNAPNADYTPRAGNNFMMYSTSPADNTFGLYCTQMPSIKGGSYLEASAYVVAHRTQVWMQIEWHSATAMIGASSPGWQSVAGGYAQTLNDYTRIVHRAQAPANAAFARILIQFRGYQASNNCYGWVHKPMLCEVINLTGDPVPYAPATIGRVTQQAGAIAAIDGRTKAYLQNSVVAGTSTARLSLYAESSPGVRASAAELVADAVYLGNNRVLEVTNGLVRVNGKVAAANVEASSLSAISANIGLLKSAESGRRTEIDNYGVRSYHPNGNLAVRMGTWD